MSEDILKQLETCDSEPIHLLGKVQSIGCLIAFNKLTFQLTYKSLNSKNYFQQTELSKNTLLSDLFDTKFITFLESFINTEFYNELYPEKISINNQHFNCFISNSHEHFILEFEKTTLENKPTILNDIDTIASSIKSIKTHQHLFSYTVKKFRDLFDFDRIMIYKFDEKGDGEIVAEEKALGLESFFGLKYPATDIPQQARRLYLTNISRSINDISDEGIEIQNLEEIKKELDLSYSVFRSVSPVHIQYLKNMGVTATHAVSIILEDKLWGMVIYHHYSGPKFLNFEQRMAAQILTNQITQKIELLNLIELEQSSSKIQSICSKIIYSSVEDNEFDISLNNWDVLSHELKSCGFTLVKNNGIENHSITPNSETTIHINNNLNNSSVKNFYTCDSLRDKFEIKENKGIAGFIRITLLDSENKHIYFWRLEKEKEVNWAGNPEKSMEVQEINNRLVLTPRSSFQLWKEKVLGFSSPWSEIDVNNSKLIHDAFSTFLIKKYNQFAEQNKNTVNNENSLKNLLSEKTEELQNLNNQLQEEFEENKKYQQELEIAKKASEELNHIKSNFISNLSHEIKTPLNGILGLANLITSDNKNIDELKYFGQLIIESCDRLKNTVNKILSISKIENNKIKIDIEFFNFKDFIEETIEPLSILAKQKNQNLIVIHKNDNLTCYSDKHYLGQIISNLVGNAIKYTNQNGIIEITSNAILDEKTNYFILTIEDNGIGIKEAVISKIFDPFFTEADVPRQLDESSGLGLYIVKTYLEYLGGTIDVESIKDKGSKFTIKIPNKNE